MIDNMARNLRRLGKQRNACGRVGELLRECRTLARGISRLVGRHRARREDFLEQELTGCWPCSWATLLSQQTKAFAAIALPYWVLTGRFPGTTRAW
jgi:hypothetical protein